MNKVEVQTLKPDQYSQWDTFVDLSPQGDFFCYSWWLEAVTKSNFKILVIIEKDQICAGIPLAFDAQNKVNIPPLTRTLGVLYKSQVSLSEYKQISNQRRWLSALLKQLPPDDFVQMCMHQNFTDWLPFRWKGFMQTTRYTYIIHYQNKTSGELWKNLNWGRRNSVQRSINNNLRVETTDDFDLLYHFECLSYERQGLKFKIPFEDLKLLDEAIKEKGSRAIFKATDNLNQVHAMLYVVFNAKSSCLLMSGSDDKYRNMGGHTLVLWEAVRYFCDKSDCFNFCGSDIQKIEAHFRGFGGTLTPYFLIYNEKLIWKRNDIRHHLGETSFHLIEASKILKDKILRVIRLR